MIKDTRTNQCDWNGADKTGRKQRSGTTTADKCWDWCFDDKDCVFAAYKGGTCRGFQTCSTKMGYVNYGWTVYQKVNQDAPYDPVDNRWAGERCDDDCIKYKKEWVGDGVCDHDSCATCPDWTKNGKFDGGDCGNADDEVSVAAWSKKKS